MNYFANDCMQVLNASVNDLAQVVVDFCSSPCYTDTVLPCASDSNLGSSVQGIVEGLKLHGVYIRNIVMSLVLVSSSEHTCSLQ